MELNLVQVVPDKTVGACSLDSFLPMQLVSWQRLFRFLAWGLKWLQVSVCHQLLSFLLLCGGTLRGIPQMALAFLVFVTMIPCAAARDTFRFPLTPCVSSLTPLVPPLIWWPFQMNSLEKINGTWCLNVSVFYACFLALLFELFGSDIFKYSL